MKALSTLACLFLFAPAAEAHKLTFDDEIWCPDLNHDGSTDFLDVGVLLALQGGECPAPTLGPCPGDFNHSHTVGDGDLRVVLGNWGPCPLKGDANRDGVLDLDDLTAVEDDLGRDCRADLDHDGRVSGNDIEIAEAVWGAGDDPHLAAAEVDGDPALTTLDLLAVIEALGRSCHSDVNHDGTVDQQDLDIVCELVCPES